MEVVASLSQGRIAAVQCGLFTHKSVPVIFEPPCIFGHQLTVSFSVKTLHLKVVHVEVGLTTKYSYREVPPEHALHTGVVNMPKITYILFSNLGTHTEMSSQAFSIPS